MIKKLIVGIILLLSLAAAQDTLASSLEEKQFQRFNEKQLQVMKKAYELGEPFNMGYTLAAIAWQESSAGLYLINLSDPSAGVFHNNINSVMARHPDIANNAFQRNVMAQKLVQDMEFSASEALSELEFWKSEYGEGNWFLIWQSYNGGYYAVRPETKGYEQSYEYAKAINRKVNFLIKLNLWNKNVRKG